MDTSKDQDSIGAFVLAVVIVAIGVILHLVNG